MPTIIKSSVTPTGSGGPDLLVSAFDVRIQTGSLEFLDSTGTKVTTKVAAMLTARMLTLNSGQSGGIYLKDDGSDAVVTQHPDTGVQEDTAHRHRLLHHLREDRLGGILDQRQRGRHAVQQIGGETLRDDHQG